MSFRNFHSLGSLFSNELLCTTHGCGTGASSRLWTGRIACWRVSKLVSVALNRGKVTFSALERVNGCVKWRWNKRCFFCRNFLLLLHYLVIVFFVFHLLVAHLIFSLLFVFLERVGSWSSRNGGGWFLVEELSVRQKRRCRGKYWVIWIRSIHIQVLGSSIVQFLLESCTDTFLLLQMAICRLPLLGTSNSDIASCVEMRW
mmetsp:Transcript_32634/g.79148  ORF Transcript_32634/g.79148 Transcript_32634/m.79148 type:complete len:201 (-) Transcript_32634:1705-2307(-)